MRRNFVSGISCHRRKKSSWVCNALDLGDGVVGEGVGLLEGSIELGGSATHVDAAAGKLVSCGLALKACMIVTRECQNQTVLVDDVWWFEDSSGRRVRFAAIVEVQK